MVFLSVIASKAKQSQAVPRLIEKHFRQASKAGAGEVFNTPPG
jgi:hypothetical protein